MHETSDYVTSSQQKREEVQKIARTMKRISELEAEIGKETKNRRVLKAEYASGITGLDDPTNPHSKFYVKAA